MKELALKVYEENDDYTIDCLICKRSRCEYVAEYFDNGAVIHAGLHERCFDMQMNRYKREADSVVLSEAVKLYIQELLAAPPRSTLHIEVGLKQVYSMLGELFHLRKQRDELQNKNTELLMELREAKRELKRD